MKAVISTTYSDTYLYFLPIVTYCWNKLGVDVICFMPGIKSKVHFVDGNFILDGDERVVLIQTTMNKMGFKYSSQRFNAPEHKEATYAQCSRLYAGCLDLPEDEILIVSDCDMGNFKIPPYQNNITICGSDLVPKEQFPMCYASGTVKDWRSAMKLQYGSISAELHSTFELHTKTYQQCLDELLGEIECEHMRGNYWGKDQQTLWENTKNIAILIPRAREGTQFAENRVDRDDINWRSYVNENLVDAHLWRNGYEEQNHKNIMELLTAMYPNDSFEWLETYRNEYFKLIQ